MGETMKIDGSVGGWGENMGKTMEKLRSLWLLMGNWYLHWRWRILKIIGEWFLNIRIDCEIWGFDGIVLVILWEIYWWFHWDWWDLHCNWMGCSRNYWDTIVSGCVWKLEGFVRLQRLSNLAWNPRIGRISIAKLLGGLDTCIFPYRLGISNHPNWLTHIFRLNHHGHHGHSVQGSSRTRCASHRWWEKWPVGVRRSFWRRMFLVPSTYQWI